MVPGSKRASVPSWVKVVDLVTLALAALSVIVLLTGGIRTHVAGVRLSITSVTRNLYWALALALVRHAVWRRPTLFERVRDSRSTARVRTWLSAHRLLVTTEETPALPALATNKTSATLEYLGVAALLAALTIALTYPQITLLDKVRDRGDPLFSIWRLAWVAHQLPRDPIHLFDANIFYPAKHTLALSDSMLLPGLVCAPFFWLGFSPVKIYTFALLASFVLCGLSMYALVRALTGRRLAALVAGVIFAFYPFRFEHYSHFELLLPFWMPLVLLALHLAVRTGRRRYGLLAGLGLAAQTFSCLYFGVFLSLFLVPVVATLAIGGQAIARSARALIPGAVLATLLVVPLAWPYVAARAQFGGRNLGEISFYSPTAARYLVAHPSSVTWSHLWGDLPSLQHLPEQDLFPGILVVVLAIVGLWPPLSVSRVAYLAALLVAFDASLGVHGHLYPQLYDTLAPFRSIRVPARLSMLVGLALAVLAGYGVARVLSGMRGAAARGAVAAGLCAVVCIETRPVLTFEQPDQPHAIYSWFKSRPPSAIAELPTPGDAPERLVWDVRFQYFSLLHWQKLLNGNSGILPESYLRFSVGMTTFPDDASLALLRRYGADYVVVHEEYYQEKAEYRRVVEASADRADLVEVARAVDRGTEARVYKLVR